MYDLWMALTGSYSLINTCLFSIEICQSTQSVFNYINGLLAAYSSHKHVRYKQVNNKSHCKHRFTNDEHMHAYATTSTTKIHRNEFW